MSHARESGPVLTMTIPAVTRGRGRPKGSVTEDQQIADLRVAFDRFVRSPRHTVRECMRLHGLSRRAVFYATDRALGYDCPESLALRRAREDIG